MFLSKYVTLMGAALVLLAQEVRAQGTDCTCYGEDPLASGDDSALQTCICNGIIEVDWITDVPMVDDMVAIYRCEDADSGFDTQPLTFLWACDQGAPGACIDTSGNPIFDTDPGLNYPFEWPPPPCECLVVIYQRGDIAGSSPPPYEHVVIGEEFIIYDDVLCPEPSEAPSSEPTPEPSPAPTPAPVIPATDPPEVCTEENNCYFKCEKDGPAPCDRPTDIVFVYDPRSCLDSANNNTQEGKWECTEGTAASGSSLYLEVDGFSPIGPFGVGDCISVGANPGVVSCTDPFTTTTGGPVRRQLYVPDDSYSMGALRARELKSRSGDGGGGGGGSCAFRFDAQTDFSVTDGLNGPVVQTNSIHTSCSKGLCVGDVYASLTVKYMFFV